jgi:K+-transporting ATPase ATPase B chain
MLMVTFPAVAPLNVMHLASPNSAILSAVIFNALIIVLLIPLALRGVQFKPMPAMALLQRNLLIYGVGGVIAPFIGIKAHREPGVNVLCLNLALDRQAPAAK